MAAKRKGLRIALYAVLGIFLALALLAVAGACLYYWQIKPNVVEPVREVLTNDNPDMSISMNMLLDELESVLHEEDVRNYINTENPQKTDELLQMLEQAREKNSSSEQTAEPEAETSERPEQEQAAENEPSDNTDSTSSVPDSNSGSDRYSDIMENVAPSDLTDALALSGKVDAGYILGLLGGGLTIEEKSELKTYLMGRLSSSEISRGIELFAKYSYLL